MLSPKVERGIALLSFLLALLVSGCRGGSNSTERATQVVAATPAPQASEAGPAGSYECTLESSQDTLTGPCQIRRHSGQDHFEMSLGAHAIRGTVEAAAHGLVFEGTMDERALSADLMIQGGGNFASVLEPEPGTLYTLRLRKLDRATEN